MSNCVEMEVTSVTVKSKSVDNCKNLNKELQRLLSLAENANGTELVNILEEVLNHPEIHVFGEFLELDSVKNINNTQYQPWLELVRLFAFGKLSDYNSEIMPPLTDALLKKLRYLTIVTLGSEAKKIPYQKLLDELKVNNLRDLEDLIIEAIYAGLIKGKLDQKESCLEVDSTMARDIGREQIDNMVSVLSNWLINCENVLTNIDQQIQLANRTKAENINKKIELENYINTLKKNIKPFNQEVEEAWEVNSGSSPPNRDGFEKTKKTLSKDGFKGQGKGSVKGWNKRTNIL